MTTEHVFPQAMQAGNMAIAEGGMSLRDYFAAKASEDDILHQARSMDELAFDWRSTARYMHADAMLRARQQPATTN